MGITISYLQAPCHGRSALNTEVMMMRRNSSAVVPRSRSRKSQLIKHVDLAQPEHGSLPLGDDKASPAVDLPRIERAVREIMIAIGEDPDREGLRRTPNRIARAYAELTAGLRIDPCAYLNTVFHEGDYNQIVLLRNIPFHSICEHHFLPFVGHAHVAYLPHKRVVGLSKLARVVEGFALRPQVQERLTDQIADAIMKCLRPLGAICIIDASHTCMTIRGIKKPGSTLVTSAIRGTFVRNQATRNEVLNLIYGSAKL
jgi:GTP cyclohydrolase I